MTPRLWLHATIFALAGASVITGAVMAGWALVEVVVR